MTNHTGLKLITNDGFKKSMKTSCTVNMDNEVIKSDDFVTVAVNQATGETTIHCNADAVTLAQAHVLVQSAFMDAMNKLTENERNEVLAVL